MSDFVDRCRREWKTLGVPDPLAEEMATDLTADIADAESEGVSVEELLGRSAFDPKSFAASWAIERGVVPAPAAARGYARRRPLVLVAFTAISAIGLFVAALLLATGEPKLRVVSNFHARTNVLPPAGLVGPGPGSQPLTTSASSPVEWLLLLLAIVALGFAAWLWAGWARSRPSSAHV